MIRPHIHVPFDRIAEHLPFIQSLRLDLEIYFSAHILDNTPLSEIETMMKALDYGPSLSIHGPFMDLCPGAVDHRIREVTISRFSQTLAIAGLIRPKTIVFHSGYEKWKYALNIDIWLENSISLWAPLLDRAESIGTRIAIENIFEDTPDNLEALVQRISSDSFGLCFDTGHFNLFSTIPLDDWLKRTAGHILVYHLHDNDTTSDAHNPIGSGTFDFRRFFDIMGQRSDIVHTIEAHSPENALKSMENLKNY